MRHDHRNAEGEAFDGLSINPFAVCGMFDLCDHCYSTKEKSATASLVRQSLCPVFALLWQGLFFPKDALAWTSFAGGEACLKPLQ